MTYLSCVAILSTLLGQGCTAILTSDQSVLQLSTSGNPRILTLDSVTIKVFPRNGKALGVAGPVVPIFPFWESEAADRFWVQIYLLPRNGEVTFDPRRIVLETERGDTFLAAGFTGPLLYADINENNSDTAGKTLLDEKNLNTSVSAVSISAEALVGVMFETRTIDPDQHFTLVITGLEKGGQPIEVPSLKFNRLRMRHLAFLLFGPLNFQTEWAVQ